LANQILLFHGDCELLILEKINELKKKISNPSLNLEQIDAEKPNLERVVSALSTQPFMFGDKLIIIKGADLKLEIWDSVLSFLGTVPANVKVIFWANSVNKKSKIYKLIDKIGEIYEFKSYAPWEEDQLVSFLMRRVKYAGKGIERPATLRLCETCGNNLMKLSGEIEKLVTFIGDRKNIKESDVSALASPGEISVFVLSEAVADKDLAKSLTSFRILQKNGVVLVGIISLLANQFRIMLASKSRKNSMDIARIFSANPYFVKKCAKKASKFSEADLERNLGLLLETDLKLKSGGEQGTAFELLLTELCSG